MDGVIFMFPEEIIEILQKYQDSNCNPIIKINKNISEIISHLEKINENIASQLHNHLTMKNTDNTKELLNDSSTLIEYINSIKMLEISKSETNQGIATEEISEELTPIFEKKVHPYIVSDDICPFCNVKLTNHTIFYQRNINNKLTNEIVLWDRCPACNKLFALDCEVDDFDFNNTNIIFNSEYCDKTEFNDAIVVSNINKCSNHNHKIEDVNCELPVIMSNGEIIQKIVPVIHCNTCRKYVMLKSTYNNLNGIPICVIIDETCSGSFTENDFYYGDGSGSKLNQYGYNVNCVDKLSIEQRHTILKTLLLAKYITKGEIYSILDTNIKRGSNRNESRRNWSKAVEKWQSDKKYVENIDLDEETKKINIDKLILKYIVR